MGKKPKQKQSHGSFFASSGLVAAVALVAVVVLWSRSSVGSPPTAKSSSTSHGSSGDDRADIVRRALFDKDGRPNYETGATPDRKRFSDHEYWEERYAAADKDYDWYGTWNSQSAVRLKSYVQHLLPEPQGRSVLNLGCGNSRMAEELHLDGWPSVVSVDISQAVIDQMSRRFAGREGLEFRRMDATSLLFESARFDVVLEKGTLDAMYTGGAAAVGASVAEVFRVLRPGGVFVSMTFGAPGSRKELNLSSAPSWGRFHTIAARKDTGARVALEDIDASIGRGEELEFFYIYVMHKPL